MEMLNIGTDETLTVTVEGTPAIRWELLFKNAASTSLTIKCCHLGKGGNSFTIPKKQAAFSSNNGSSVSLQQYFSNTRTTISITTGNNATMAGIFFICPADGESWGWSRGGRKNAQQQQSWVKLAISDLQEQSRKKNDLWKRVFMERRKMTRNYIIGWERWKNDKTAGKCFGYL